MKPFPDKSIWFITGSQNLYGPEVLRKVDEHSRIITKYINEKAPVNIEYKGVVTTSDEILAKIKEVNTDDHCAGIITWMHTFSPSKMWINGLAILNKPLLHLHTQFNTEIPFDDIDMDFMNLNQSAHGDREHGFIGARMRIKRKVVAGHWQDKNVLDRINSWARCAIGINVGKSLKVARFGDNMREVAVTEGDKIETQIKLGWSVNSYGIGELVDAMKLISETEIDRIYEECRQKYQIATLDIAAIRYQLRIEASLKKFFKENDIGAFTTTFEDLWGMQQLPGLASQRLMEAGYGFGAEGDWKTSALLRIIKIMQKEIKGGSTFMEDYTYHFIKDHELVLGAHMLEICPSIADGNIRIDVKPLSIGEKADPARMIFDGSAGKAICASLIDIGGRMRLIVADVEAVSPIHDMPQLPVARVMWRLFPNFSEGAEAWIIAGGAHHSVMSYAITADMMRDFAEMADIEFVHIGTHTKVEKLKHELQIADIIWKLM